MLIRPPAELESWLFGLDEHALPSLLLFPPWTHPLPPFNPPAGLWIILGAGVGAALLWLICLRLWKRRRLAQKRARAAAEAAAAAAKLGLEGGPDPLVLGEHSGAANGQQVCGVGEGCTGAGIAAAAATWELNVTKRQACTACCAPQHAQYAGCSELLCKLPCCVRPPNNQQSKPRHHQYKAGVAFRQTVSIYGAQIGTHRREAEAAAAAAQESGWEGGLGGASSRSLGSLPQSQVRGFWGCCGSEA